MAFDLFLGVRLRQMFGAAMEHLPGIVLVFALAMIGFILPSTG